MDVEKRAELPHPSKYLETAFNEFSDCPLLYSLDFDFETELLACIEHHQLDFIETHATFDHFRELLEVERDRQAFNKGGFSKYTYSRKIESTLLLFGLIATRHFQNRIAAEIPHEMPVEEIKRKCKAALSQLYGFEFRYLIEAWETILGFAEDRIAEAAGEHADKLATGYYLQPPVANQKALPPLVRILMDKKTYVKEAIMLFEAIFPEYGDGADVNKREVRLSQKRRAKILAAISGKEIETIRTDWSDVRGKDFQSTPTFKAYTERVEKWLSELGL